MDENKRICLPVPQPRSRMFAAMGRVGIMLRVHSSKFFVDFLLVEILFSRNAFEVALSSNLFLD